MEQKLHKNATTTFRIRQEIQKSKEPVNSLAEKYGVGWKTVKKWKKRKSVEDKSSRPEHLNISLTQEKEDLIVFERRQFKKTIEEIFFTLEEKIDNLYPMKIYRCLKRYGLNVLPDEFIDAERKIRKFRRYTIGYLHIDLMYAPKLSGKRWYIFTCIDRVSKIAFVWVTDRKTKEMGARFLKMVLKFYPYKINYILTDNGTEFCYKALRKKTKKVHPFVGICKEEKISHRTIKFKHPWTNGMVERFNRKIKDNVIKKYVFSDIDDLKEELVEYINNYNFKKRLRGLSYKTPNDFLRESYNYSVQRIVI